jgi:hypothetical protein
MCTIFINVAEKYIIASTFDIIGFIQWSTITLGFSFVPD